MIKKEKVPILAPKPELFDLDFVLFHSFKTYKSRISISKDHPATQD